MAANGEPSDHADSRSAPQSCANRLGLVDLLEIKDIEIKAHLFSTRPRAALFHKAAYANRSSSADSLTC
jgi:hypothetical protein